MALNGNLWGLSRGSVSNVNTTINNTSGQQLLRLGTAILSPAYLYVIR